MPDNKKNQSKLSIRLDKWLWAARFCKTRSVARDLIQSGKVQYNNQRCKPGRLVELGAKVKVPQGYDILEVSVLELSEQRRGAPLAQLMYEESAESVLQRQKNAEAKKLGALYSPRPEHKPDKKQRRQIIQFKHQ